MIDRTALGYDSFGGARAAPQKLDTPTDVVNARVATMQQAREAQANDAARAQAAMPAKPTDWDKLSPVSRRSWFLAVQKLGENR